MTNFNNSETSINNKKTQNNNKNIKKQSKNKEKSRKKIIFTKTGKLIYFPIFIGIVAVFITSIVLICVFPNTKIPKATKESTDNWPKNIVAPFVDMASWITPGTEYSLNGVPNINKVEEQTGIKYYNLGFIQPDKTTPLNQDGTIRWGFGGLYKLSEKGNDGYQYPKIKQVIETLQKQSAIYTISVGGQAGTSPWMVTSNVNKLEEMYLDIISTYNLKRLDLDIEMSNQDYNQNVVNARAIKAVQDKTGVEITLTVPIMPHGWDEKQTNLIKAYFDQGVAVQTINSMTMCYGTGVYENEDYGTASVRAMNNAFRQIKEIYANYGNLISDDLAYQKLGATYSIGYESNVYPVFTTDMSRTIVDDAKLHNYGMVSFWSMGRDAKLESNSAITTTFEFSKILKEYNNDNE